VIIAVTLLAGCASALGPPFLVDVTVSANIDGEWYHGTTRTAARSRPAAEGLTQRWALDPGGAMVQGPNGKTVLLRFMDNGHAITPGHVAHAAASGSAGFVSDVFYLADRLPNPSTLTMYAGFFGRFGMPEVSGYNVTGMLRRVEGAVPPMPPRREAPSEGRLYGGFLGCKVSISRALHQRLSELAPGAVVRDVERAEFSGLFAELHAEKRWPGVVNQCPFELAPEAPDSWRVQRRATGVARHFLISDWEQFAETKSIAPLWRRAAQKLGRISLDGRSATALRAEWRIVVVAPEEPAIYVFETKAVLYRSLEDFLR
jgi:hypothetical protein